LSGKEDGQGNSKRGDRKGKLKRETQNSQGGRREKTMKNSIGFVILSNGKKGVSH